MQQVQRACVSPVPVVDKEYERIACSQRLNQARNRLEQMLARRVLFLRGLRQVGITLAQFRQEAGELAEPQVGEQIFGGVFPFKPLAQQMGDGLVGITGARREASAIQHIRTLRRHPGQELLRETTLANPRVTEERDNLERVATCLPIRVDQSLKFTLAPHKGRDQSLLRMSAIRSMVCVRLDLLVTNAGEQRLGFCRRLDAQFLQQDAAAQFVLSQRCAALSG